MIKGLNAGRYMLVEGGFTSYPQNNYSSSDTGGKGMVKFDYNSQNFQVNNGISWEPIASSYTTVKLSGEAESMLDYVRALQNMDVVGILHKYETDKREAEARRQRMIKEHPQLGPAHEAIKRAEENFETLYKFVEHDVASESENVLSSP